MSEEEGVVAPEATETPTPTNWYGEIEDTELSEWAGNKNFQTPSDALKSYRKLEQFMGADKAGRGVVMPKEGADQGEWDNFYTAIGRPNDAKGYELPVPEGEDGAFAEKMSEIMHQSGIPKAAAHKLAEAWNEYAGDTQSQHEKAAEDAYFEQEYALKKEWGGAYDANVEKAKANYRQFGIEEDHLDSLEKAMGFDGAMKFMYNIGAKIGEDGYVDGGMEIDLAREAMTPARAAEELEKFNSDPENFIKLSNGDVKTVQTRKNILKYL